jgi:putative FmdB family regulatory protein
MPIYEYRCDDCGAEFEKRVARASDSDGVLCPSCGRKRLTMRFSTFATVTGRPTSSDAAPACPSAGSCPNRNLCGMQ